MQWFIRNYRFIQSIRTTVASVSIVLASLAIAQTQDSTLYIAQLRAQNGVNSSGSGTATLRLSGDETSAIVAFSYSNLTSPITGLHIHGPADPGQSAGILFDVDSATPESDGTYLWVIAPTGAYTVADIVEAIKSGRTYLNIHTATYPAGEISGWFNLSTGSQITPVPTPPPPLASGTPTPQDAGRFLSQATFGATDALISQVQTEGFDAFLNEQFAAPISSHMAFADATGVRPLTFQQTTDAWWTYAVSAPDQLRQRVAFALSEVLVVSKNRTILGSQPGALPTYMDVLVNNAFGNFRQLLQGITLNPAMGYYLDMLGSDKATNKTLPNENYAREIMQLFSIGLYKLNLDGSLTLDSSGSPIATYDQGAVRGLAAVFTGWTFAQSGTPVWRMPPRNWRAPMINIATHHQTTAKQILDGVAIPAGQTADQDLQMALDTIFNHPNVGPFICRQLIQRLVTSNPSPGYIYRVASVFNDNGQGVRGDLQAVVRAILMDYDARGTASTAQGAGHEREPDIHLTNLLRAFHASSPNGTISVSAISLQGTAPQLAQEPMNSPTVFNFFSPDYQAPGAIAQAGLYSPEFQLTVESVVTNIANFLNKTIYSYLGTTNRVTLNFSNELPLAANPTQLVDHLNLLLMAGNMSPSMRATLINAVTSIPAKNSKERVQTAIYLVVNSPEFVIDK
jgi:endo-chitodextinase